LRFGLVCEKVGRAGESSRRYVLKRRRWWLLGGGVSAGMLVAAGWWHFFAEHGDARLNAFVYARPPVSIVFTSRTEPASLRAAAPSGEVFVYPGQRLWQSREGRLRLLTPQGAVRELTWGQALPDGGALIDVMSPSVSLDGRKIVFAGRRADDHGHFRIYEIGIDGRDLRPLTGGPDDPGCTAVPPMRYAADGMTRLPDEERQRIDYDDVDPIYLDSTSTVIGFASSRTPDLGRGHARRSTTLWLTHLGSVQKYPLSANRYNDRWPFLLTSGYVGFSLWSHNQEIISADERAVQPSEPGVVGATAPVDMWQGAMIHPAGSVFGALIKPQVPVWRPRPLFNGRIVFMTTFDYAQFNPEAPEVPALRVVQAEAGLLHNAPSSLPVGAVLPAQKGCRLEEAPTMDSHGRRLGSWATPSPCPTHHVVLAAAAAPGSYGIYLTSDGAWGDADARLTLLFDDPGLVDAEPVAIYARRSSSWGAIPAPAVTSGSATGNVFNKALYSFFNGELPGQQTDLGEGPIFDVPPAQSLHSIRVYASRRDQFDDPVRPRVPGSFELLTESRVNNHTSFGARLPAGVPTVLAGFTQEGRVLRWTTAAKDAQGRQASFYAFAGDHYSAVRPQGKHTCTGCHPGHSALPRGGQNHAEQLR
jgi:hypothetical protein